MNEQLTMPAAVQETYGPDDVSRTPFFAGGFINFGHWQDIDLGRPLDGAARIRSQENLYRCVLDAALPPGAPVPRVLEVGCGIGMGCALALREYGAALTGMDIHPEQLRRARTAHAELLAAEPERLRFVHGTAEQLPFGEGEFDAVVSVEAAQHFPELTPFAAETARVLRPGGRVAVATFFAVDDVPGRRARLAELLPEFPAGLDHAHPVRALTDAFAAAGLTEVRATSIGPHVWSGWDAWVSKFWAPETWPRNFLRAYREGYYDYYLVTAGAPR
ncbi:class I SAM-dependent methyltransferase [Kitasatospora sp. NPDC004272]